MAHLGELIAELRQDKGLTQKELGDILLRNGYDPMYSSVRY